MAKRIWRAEPDSVYRFVDEDDELVEIPFVSRDLLVSTILDGATLLDVTGGTFSVIVGREPTDVPGEALTTGVVCEWRDGPRAKAHPEAPVAVPTRAVVDVDRSDPRDEEPVTLDDEIGDGLDEAALPDEDLSAIPETQR